MRRLQDPLQKPLGQILLATLLFTFIFTVLFVGLYKAGVAYVLKERARRATTLTALTGGSVYANGLQLVRDSNRLLMVCVDVDLFKDGLAAAAASPGGPPAMVSAAYGADKMNSRTAFQKFQDLFFGVDSPGVYPLLIESQALAAANENQLKFLPIYAYNYETATTTDVAIPNLALRFRTASELLPDVQKGSYSLLHKGERLYFSSEEIESAGNPKHPHQMRVKKGSNSEFAGWWVRKEKGGLNSGKGESSLTKLGPRDLIKQLKGFLDHFKFDVTDRDDPPCHTFTLLSDMSGKIGREEKSFYQAGEVRVETDGLTAWDIGHSFDIYSQKVDIETFPVLKGALQKLKNVPVIDQLLKSSDLLSGI